MDITANDILQVLMRKVLNYKKLMKVLISMKIINDRREPNGKLLGLGSLVVKVGDYGTKKFESRHFIGFSRIH